MRKVDQNERPGQLADVIVDIVAERGVDAVSVREVANRAGVSIGTVQHYFPTKDQMLAFAVDHVGERIVARMHECTEGRSFGECLRKVLLELVPLDAQRTEEAKVWFSFLARAVFTPDLLWRAQHTGRAIEDVIAEAIRSAQEEGQVAPEIDPARSAKVIYTLVDGLTARVLTDPERIDPAETTTILDSYLHQLFPELPQLG